MDGQTVNPEEGPAFTAEDAAAGRKLVGSAGLNCIQCHGIAGRPATGTPGPDLTQMVRRLRYDRFFAWVSDPKLAPPSTRMPSFFVDGHSERPTCSTARPGADPRHLVVSLAGPVAGTAGGHG